MFSNVWSENTALFERLMEIHSNSPKLYYGFKLCDSAHNILGTLNNVSTKFAKRRVRYARFIWILQLIIYSPQKQSHFVKYRATQIVFRRKTEQSRAVSKGAATGNQGRYSSSISSPWSLQVRPWILFCSFLVKL